MLHLSRKLFVNTPRFAISGLLVAAIILDAPRPSGAATLTVDTVDDETNSDGDCSLREAIASANTDTQVDNCVPSGPFGDDTIALPAGTYTLSTVATELNINDVSAPNALTVSGTDPATTIIEANAAADTATFRVFNVSGGSVTLQHLTIRNGGGTANGAGILFNPANNSTLNVSDCVIADNRTTGNGGGLAVTSNPFTLNFNDTTFSGNRATGSGATGGAANILGTNGTNLSITDCTFEDNQAKGSGGAIKLGQNIASATFTRATFNDNLVDGSGADGGAISTQATTLTITDSTFDGNQARDEGGALRVGAGATTTTISGSTFQNNRATLGTSGDGGALRELSSSLTITNSTFFNNAANNDGGAIHKGGSGTLTLNNVTVTGNFADDDANGGGDGGGIRRGNGPINIANSIIAANTDKSASTKHPDCSTGNSAAVVSQGYNLIGVGNLGGCTGFVDASNGDQVGTNTTPKDPLLGGIGANGGPTETILPLSGSPVIDAGNPNAPLDGGLDAGTPALRRCAAVDQRGIARPVGPRCDSGAAEFSNTATPTPTDTPTPTHTPSPTDTPTPTPTEVPTDTASPTPTDTPTASPTDTPSHTPTATATDTATPTDTPSPTPTDTPTETPTGAPTETATATPTISATATATPTVTDTPTPTPTPTSGAVICGTPVAGCHPAGAASLVIQNHGTKPSYDHVRWLWRKGAMSVSELGDPLSSTEYAFCIFDAQNQVIVAATIPPLSHWRRYNDGTGFRYVDRSGSQEGTLALTLRASSGGRTRLRAKLGGKANTLGNPGGPDSGNFPDLPVLPFDNLLLPLRAQVLNGAGSCWESTMTELKLNLSRPKVGRYRAVGP